MEKYETNIKVDIFETALQELNQITKNIPVSEDSCINCKYRSSYAGQYNSVIVKCRYGCEDGNWDAGKFIGKFNMDSLQTKNRRYSVRRRSELTRKRIAHICPNHVKDETRLII